MVKLSLNRGPFTTHGKIGIEQIKPLCRMSGLVELTANLPVDGKHMFVGGSKVLRGL